MIREKKAPIIAVGMSGGVDSSVCAYLLKQQGYQVFGLFMKNWEEEEGETCHAQQDYEDVALVCSQIDIPFYSVNFAKEYWDTVFQDFLRELELGLTPNPDILCNREIKFNVLLKKAKELGADVLATGHYARILDRQLQKGIDPNKDQSYFLYTLKESTLEHILFPIGHLNKTEVRKIAKEANIPTCNKKDSTGICFIGKRNFRTFVQKYLSGQQGHFVDLEGNILGKHQGIPFYTIGQRKGLGIGGAGDAWFVADKKKERNQILVVQGKNHPALFAKTLFANELTWVSSKCILPMRCKAKIRYRQQEQPCFVESINPDQIKVTFASPQRAITPRQSIVFYDKERCLGGAMIEYRGPTEYEKKKGFESEYDHLEWESKAAFQTASLPTSAS